VTAVISEARGGEARPAPAAPEEAAVATHELTKRFRGGQVAVDHIDMVVPYGGVYGFLGPNGSGKTTTIRMLLDLITPTAGTHRLLGRPMPASAAEVLPRVGALVEGPAFHPHLSGWANLARLDAADRTADPATSRDRIGVALERVGLSAAARKRYRAYSLGMRQRLGIAASLLQPRELLILDEPTNGLDPQGTREVRALVSSLAGDGVTVLLSSHLLSEVEQICSHVGVMHVGKLVAQGTLADLRAGQATRVRVETPEPARAAETLRRLGLADVVLHGSEGAASNGAVRSAGALLGDLAPEAAVAALVHDGVPVRQFTVDRPALEDVFVSLTGEGFDVNG
jgi:ABC-type multidrug transport system ATPase subunit